MDETLIHATARPLEQPADFQVFQYHVYKRPGLDDFLREMAAHFQLAIWLSASDDYVREIVSHILPPTIPLAFV